MAEKRVALVLSGGVSLGSYIAGALDEIIAAFEATHDSVDGDRYVIDVITGASAGAATAAIVAHALLYRGGRTRLHDAWVDRIDILNLLDPQVGEQLSLLSGDQLHSIATEVLDWSSSGAQRVRARCCAPELTVGLTLSNIDPLPYQSGERMRAAAQSLPFVQLRHAEQETFVFTADLEPNSALWTRVSQVAIASAAIPFIFPLVRLKRNLDDPLQYLRDSCGSGPIYTEGDTEREFLYCDGGTFNNLPIDLAWYYVRQIDRALDGTELDQVSQNRLIVMIDPSPEAARNRRQGGPAPYPNLIQFASKLVGALWTESSAVQFESQVVQPARTNLPPPTQVGTPIPPLVEAASPVEVPPADDELLMPKTLPGEMPSDGPVPEDAPDVGDGPLIEKAIPGVNRPLDELLDHVALVTPEGPRLRGSYLLMSLSGFLDWRFREYDYRRGRADGRRLARSAVLGINYQPAQAEEYYQPDADGALGPPIPTYASLNFPSSHGGGTVREAFEGALHKRLRALLYAAVDAIDPPGPNRPYAYALDALLALAFGKVRDQLPGLWHGDTVDQGETAHEPHV